MNRRDLIAPPDVARRAAVAEGVVVELAVDKGRGPGRALAPEADCLNILPDVFRGDIVSGMLAREEERESRVSKDKPTDANFMDNGLHPSFHGPAPAGEAVDCIAQRDNGDEPDGAALLGRHLA